MKEHRAWRPVNEFENGEKPGREEKRGTSTRRLSCDLSRKAMLTQGVRGFY
jgi:hypothetical protein